MHPLPLEYVQVRQKAQYHHVQSNLPKRLFYRIIMSHICLHNQVNFLAVATQYHIEYADTEVLSSPAFSPSLGWLLMPLLNGLLMPVFLIS